MISRDVLACSRGATWGGGRHDFRIILPSVSFNMKQSEGNQPSAETRTGIYLIHDREINGTNMRMFWDETIF